MAPSDRGAVMSRAKKSNSTSATKREPIALPAWLPSPVAWQVRRIEERNPPTAQYEILIRLATDDRMQKVWKELLRKQRVGQFKYPASPNDPTLAAHEAQAKALAITFFYAFSVACDQLPVSKLEPVNEPKTILLAKAEILLDIADDLAVTLTQPLCNAETSAEGLADVTALRRVANWLISNVDQHLRASDDPLTIEYDRGDPVARGVPIAIAAWFEKTFGNRLYGTAATLGSVALGQQTSERATRSAFSGRKEVPKKRFGKSKKAP